MRTQLAKATLLLVTAVCTAWAGCASAPSSGLHATPPGLGRLPYSDADVDFMAGMIPHHAQAVIMAGWAPSHGARKDVAVLCERIVVGQRDEIFMMQTWLRDRGQTVPDATSTRHHMKMNGIEHDMLMPGMLTDEEMAALDRARGPEFDRLFLTGMIKHHQGAIDMVDVLFKAYGAAQDETVFRFASDVYAVAGGVGLIVGDSVNVYTRLMFPIVKRAAGRFQRVPDVVANAVVRGEKAGQQRRVRRQRQRAMMGIGVDAPPAPARVAPPGRRGGLDAERAAVLVT